MNLGVGSTSVLRRYFVGAARMWPLVPFAVALAACAPSAPVFRDASAPIGQTVRYTPQAMAGPWIVQARFGDDLSQSAFFDADTAELETSSAAYPVGAQGLIVMWVDADVRTAVLGSADGGQGFILDRSADISPDRYRAAVDVLDFYGWDTSQLEVSK